MNRKLFRVAISLAWMFFAVSCDGSITGTGSGVTSDESIVPVSGGLYFGLAVEPPTGFPVEDSPPPLCFGNIYQQPVIDRPDSSINPPTWLQGNWIGQRFGFRPFAIVATHDNIAFGNTPTGQTALDNGPDGRDIVEVESTNSVYRIVVMEELDGRRETYTQEYTFKDAGQIIFSLIDSDFYNTESIVMSSQAPADTINPPSWLVGEWRQEQCETRLFTEGDIKIEYDNADPSISFANLLSGGLSTFQTQYVDDKQYMIVGTYLSPDGAQRLRFQELYVLREDGSVAHSTPGYTQVLTRR